LEQKSPVHLIRSLPGFKGCDMTDPRHEIAKRWMKAIRKILSQDSQYWQQVQKLNSLRDKQEKFNEFIAEEQERLAVLGDDLVGKKAYHAFTLHENDGIIPHPYPTEKELEALSSRDKS